MFITNITSRNITKHHIKSQTSPTKAYIPKTFITPTIREVECLASLKNKSINQADYFSSNWEIETILSLGKYCPNPRHIFFNMSFHLLHLFYLLGNLLDLLRNLLNLLNAHWVDGNLRRWRIPQCLGGGDLIARWVLYFIHLARHQPKSSTICCMLGP